MLLDPLQLDELEAEATKFLNQLRSEKAICKDGRNRGRRAIAIVIALARRIAAEGRR